MNTSGIDIMDSAISSLQGKKLQPLPRNAKPRSQNHKTILDPMDGLGEGREVVATWWNRHNSKSNLNQGKMHPTHKPDRPPAKKQIWIKKEDPSKKIGNKGKGKRACSYLPLFFLPNMTPHGP